MSGMNPTLDKLGGTTMGTASHAHLLVAESGGLIARESPEAVMEEVEFRATHVSSVLAEMLEEIETGKHDSFWEPEAT